MKYFDIRDWFSVFVGLVTAGVAVLTFLRARKLGGWKAFSTDTSLGDLETATEKIKRFVAEAVPEATPENGSIYSYASTMRKV